MGRSSDWSPVDMDSDPTPGSPDEVRTLADRLQTFADDVGEALGRVRGMSEDRAVMDWAGLSAEAFRSEFDGVPGNLEKLRTSYDMAGQALRTYWPKLETAQGMADRALDRAIAAQADLTSAQGALTDAQDWVSRAGDEADRLEREGEREDVEPPSEAEVRAATRDATAAGQARSDAQGRVDAAEEALSAARELARQAKEMREDAAGACASSIDEASDAGIQNRRWWEDAIHWVSENWDTIVEICKVVVAVLGIVVMIIGGPLAWVVLAAALVVLADTLYDYANGEASLWDVAFAALDCIPGMKGLTTLGGLARGMRSLGTMGLRGMAQNLGGLARSGRRMIGDAAEGAYSRMQNLVRSGGTDPVDLATGRMYLPQTDVVLPGTLPLVFQRRLDSGYRSGRWFGPTWSSTCDQRLEVDEQGVVLVTEDGLLLSYPHPRGPLEPVLPDRGPRWPLTRLPDGDYEITTPSARHTRRFRNPGAGQFALLHRVSDRRGNTITFAYDTSGAPTSIRHSGGYHLGVHTEAGRVTGLDLVGAGPDGSDVPIKRYGYTGGNLTEIVGSSGRPLHLAYDHRLRVTSWTDTNGSAYTYAYDDQDRCVAEGGEAGHLTLALAYDGTDPAWPDRRVTTLTTAEGAVSRFVVDGACQVVAEIDACGGVTRREYDGDHHLVALTDALGHTTRLDLDDTGQPVRVTRPDGTTSDYTYGEHALLTSATKGEAGTWHWEFDQQGNCTAASDATGATTRYDYDDLGRLTAITGPTGARTGIRCDAAGLPVEFRDPLGNVARKTRDAFGRVTAVTDPLGAVTRLSWTVEGRIARAVDPNGGERRWTYDGEGNCLSFTDTAGAVTRYEYTHFDLMSARVEPDGTRYEFTHDAALRLVEVRDPRGRSWEYEYDAAGRLVAESDFDGRRVSYRRDAAGRLVARSNPLGQTVGYAYDALGQVTAKNVDRTVTSYAYDPIGMMTRATSPTSDIRWQRDAMGRVLTEAVDGRTTSFRYDTAGQRVTRTTPAGVSSEYAYDAAGRRVAVDTAGHRLAFAHDAAGREVSRELDSGLGLTRTWDVIGRLTEQTVTAGDHLVQRLAYTYGADGHLLGVDDHLRGEATYTLDGAGRVTQVQGRDWSERYAYDATGNQTHAFWPSRHGDEETQGDREFSGGLVTRAGGVTYTHDRAGRVVERRKKRLSRKPDVWRYRWDAEDRLTSTTTPDGTVWRYRYDPLGRRTAKERLAPDGASVVERIDFTWDGTTLIEQTATAAGRSGLVTTTWDHEGLHPVAQAERISAADAPQEVVDERFFAIVTDLVGTPTELVDASGTLAWRTRSTLWGTTAWPSDSTAYTPLRFPGQYLDPETGLHYNLNRHYDPETARYSSPDPLGLAAAPNAVAYVRNPHTVSDPLGLAPCGGAVDFMDGADNYIPSGAPVTHGPNGTLIGSDARSVRNFQNVLNEGQHDVVAHGSRDGFLELPGGPVNGGQIVDAVTNNPHYAGQDIRLMVCHSGSDSSGIAQQVANELGVTVRAPTDRVGTQPALGPGQTPVIDNNGSWRIFLPIVSA
ncbi:DUF6531 domain-containing protein [Streptomyces hainanensis]|uniref:Type IV secretion protein Rhs n=1 Tax=Streptomyces hainanensis TaxID=402648 RepID=A0A4V2Y440_9ACTN|nr:DUF6531 domain-containing protein [Streptomyces hainanensis]TDC78965.1 hypothetical protein E1283_03810 [Streptomyces hainanensis]